MQSVQAMKERRKVHGARLTEEKGNHEKTIMEIVGAGFTPARGRG